MSENRIDLPFEERVIGDHTYRCNRLLLGKWIELEALVMKVLGVQILDMDEKNIGSYAPRAISQSNAADHNKMFELMGECLFVANNEGGLSILSRANQERWWAAYIGEMPGVIGLFFEVQFKDFFIGLERLMPEVKS